MATKADTFDAFAKTLTGVITAIQLKLTGSRQLPIGGQSVTVTSFTAGLQAYIDKNTATDAAKQSTQTLVKERTTLKAATKKDLADFSKWVVLQFGEAALTSFGLPLPKAHVVSPAKSAIGVAKRKAKSQAKAAAKASLTAAEETVVALNADGTPIGGAPAAAPAPSANAAVPVAAAAVTPAGK